MYTLIVPVLGTGQGSHTCCYGDSYDVIYLCVHVCRFVDGVVHLVVQGRSRPPTMSRNDLFYTKVSSFKEFFPALLQHQKAAMASMEKPQEKLVEYVSSECSAPVCGHVMPTTVPLKVVAIWAGALVHP